MERYSEREIEIKLEEFSTILLCTSVYMCDNIEHSFVRRDKTLIIYVAFA